tara:strand:- start:161 stop:682 length:522 start_codon:yes stop_codon:yes gene_type:complete
MKKLVLFIALSLSFLSKAQTYSFAIYQQEDTLGVISQSLIPGQQDILFVFPTTFQSVAQAFALVHNLKIAPITEHVYNSAFGNNLINNPITNSYRYSNPPVIKNLTAGQHLILAGQRQNIAIAVGIVGGIFSGLLVTENPEAAGIVAGISSVVAIGLNISSNNHITKAGKKLK